MKETTMHLEDQPGPMPEKKSETLAKARSLGKILREHPDIQSNSPELYVLTYLDNLGSHKI